MATRDTSPGDPSLNDHVLRLADVSNATVVAPVLDRANHTGQQTLASLSDVPVTTPIATQSFWTGTQAAYDALTPDANTIYFIEAV